jgi:response regulator of citrate/malate metabolism
MEANRPDLVIIDLLLPDGRGLDLLPENPFHTLS